MVLFALGTVGCQSDSHTSQQPVTAEPQNSQVGNICVFRPPRKSTLAFATLRGYTKFRRLEAAHAPEPYSSFQFFDDGKGWFDGKGKLGRQTSCRRMEI